MKSPYDIIKKPVLTEKSYDQMAEKCYTFEVDVHANKTEIRKAIEAVFGVKVDSVNTLRQEGKIKRQGRTQGRRPRKEKGIHQARRRLEADRILREPGAIKGRGQNGHSSL